MAVFTIDRTTAFIPALSPPEVSTARRMRVFSGGLGGIVKDDGGRKEKERVIYGTHAVPSEIRERPRRYASTLDNSRPFEGRSRKEGPGRCSLSL